MPKPTRSLRTTIACVVQPWLLSVPVIVLAIVRTVAGDDMRTLYDGHRWFELREAIAGRTVDPLYEGAVASAFNDPAAAARALKRAMARAATPVQANDARGLLAIQYIRAGRSADAAPLLEAILAAAPDRDDVSQLRATYGVWRGRPNLEVAARRRASFPCTTGGRGVRIPLTVNGHHVRWQLDTGASISVLSVSEARMLGIDPQGPVGRVGDFAGGQASAQTGVARRVVLGGIEMRDVTMLVVPDSQPPWTDAESGTRGAIGLPMVLAIGSIQWTSAGTCTVPATDGDRHQETSSLVFDWFTPVARIHWDHASLDMMLDTGNEAGTQLWARFARQFAPLLAAHGRPETRRLTQVGGSRMFEVTLISELKLRIGGIDTVLSPAIVYPPPVGNEALHGNLGLDLLRRADAVTIDFKSMAIALRSPPPGARPH